MLLILIVLPTNNVLRDLVKINPDRANRTQTVPLGTLAIYQLISAPCYREDVTVIATVQGYKLVQIIFALYLLEHVKLIQTVKPIKLVSLTLARQRLGTAPKRTIVKITKSVSTALAKLPREGVL